MGVHIADVSYFVRENTPLDAEAARRATTVRGLLATCVVWFNDANACVAARVADAAD